MSNYIVSIHKHPINGYSFEYDIVEIGEKSVGLIKSMMVEYFQEILTTINFKFDEVSIQIKVSREINKIIDNLVSCETIDDINNISAISVSKSIKKKKKYTIEPVPVTKVLEAEEPEKTTVKKKVKRIKFF